MFATVVMELSRCAAASMCPTDQEIRMALFRQSGPEVAALAQTYRAEHPNEIVSFEPRVGRIGEVHCGEPSGEQPNAVNCSFTVTDSEEIIYMVAKLARHEDYWVVMDNLSVPRSITSRRRR